MSADLGRVAPSAMVRRLRAWGSDDPAFDALMALGPPVVLAFALGGRNAVTTALAGAYVAGFVLALAYNAATGGT